MRARLIRVVNRPLNPVVRWLLRSPLHGLVSRGLILVTLSDRASGRRYALPVQYARRGDAVYVLSQPARRWWRNLIGGARVELRLRGERLEADGEVLSGSEAEEARAVFEGTPLARVVRRSPETVVIRLGDLRPLGTPIPPADATPDEAATGRQGTRERSDRRSCR
jgi:hypothetical protein